MLKNLNLSQQALILLLVPLVCEIAFVSALGLQLHQFDILLHEINHSRVFGAALNELMDNCAQVAREVDLLKQAQDKGSPSAEIQDTFKDIRQRMSGIDNELSALADNAPNPVLYEKVVRAAQPIRKIGQIVDVALDAYDSGGALALFALIRGHDKQRNEKFQDLRASLIISLGDLLQAKHEQQHDFDEKIARQEAGFHRLIVIVIVGGAMHIGLAVLLWLNFSRGTAENFRILIDNTRRLANGDPLNAPIGGKSEIAHLDRVFNDMADALAEAKRRDKEIEQMKQEFVAMISHDLRTPLTSVQACLTLLTTGLYGELSEDGKQTVSVAEANITRLIGLINELLDIEKMESGKLKIEKFEVQLSDVFERSAAAVIGFAQQQGVAIEVRPTDADLFADRDRLVQVLVNLISNAVKFSPRDSRIVVEAEELPDCVEVRVIDQGRGVPAEFREAIFERFQQVQLSDAKLKGGSGLGLAICKAIVEGHNGKIGVRCHEGDGSTFWFRIPVQHEKETSVSLPTSIEDVKA